MTEKLVQPSILGSTEERSPGRTGGEAERLLRDLNAALVRVLMARLGSYEDAREVAQEAYVRLMQLGEGNVVSYQRALLFRIALNLATDRLRAKARATLAEPPDLHEWPDPAASPERSAEARKILERLPAVLAELPPKCAQAFRLVRLDQCDFAEAAARMGLHERMVRIYVARALAYCQTRLDEISGLPEASAHD